MKQGSYQNEVLKRRIEKITRLIPELMECRSRSLVYALFLKEKFANYKLNRVVKELKPSISAPHEFFNAF